MVSRPPKKNHSRVSVDVEHSDHAYVKMCCAKKGISLRDFTVSLIVEKAREFEYECMMNRWKKDGTLDELKTLKDQKEREVYLLTKENGIFELQKSNYLKAMA